MPTLEVKKHIETKAHGHHSVIYPVAMDLHSRQMFGEK
jgi:hypothetical protein